MSGAGVLIEIVWSISDVWCSRVFNPTISFIAYQDAKPNGGRAVTRTRRGDSYMDDPRSVLESNQIFSIKRRSSNLCGRQAGHAETPFFA